MNILEFNIVSQTFTFSHLHWTSIICNEDIDLSSNNVDINFNDFAHVKYYAKNADINYTGIIKHLEDHFG